MLEKLIGFVPLAVIMLTILAALLLRGRWRWVVLWLLPASGVAICELYAPELGRDGNMLGVATALLLFVGVWIYYPLLAVVHGMSWRRRSRGQQ